MYTFEFKLKLVVYLSNQTEREMRKYGVIRVVVLLVLVALAYACGRKGVDIPQLLQADRLMEEHPDSALVILESLTGTENFTPESKAFYCLLLTEAKDKTFAVHESDSLIRIAVDYYEHSDNLLHKAKAWFYWGRVNQDLLNAERALDCYLQALPYAEEGKFYKLLGLISNYIGDLYRKLEVYDKALLYMKISCNAFELAKDTINIPYGYRNYGRAFMYNEDFDSALIYYNKALSFAENCNMVEIKATILNDLGALYGSLGEYTKAIEMIRNSIELKKENQRYSGYLSLARLLYETNYLDSANYYLGLALPSPNIYVQEGAFDYKYKVAVSQKKYQDAIFYNERHLILRDSITRKAQKEKILGVTYQYKQREIENEMRQHAARERLIYLCCIFVLLTITAIGFYLYKRNRLKHLQLLRLKEIRIQQEKELRYQSLEQIEHNRLLIESNKAKLISQELELQIAQRDLLLYNTNLLKAENEVIALRREELAFRNRLFSQTKLYEKIKCAGVDTRKKDIECTPFSLKDFPMLVCQLNELYNNFTLRLNKAYPKLKERDIEICCLVKAGAKTGNIASIIAMTPNAVTKKKRQILEKMEIVDENVTLDQFLATY